MTIESIIVHVADVERSVDFYTRFLDLEVVSRSPEEARLDAVTATLRLVRLAETDPTTFVADDLQAGFRHVGFKVSDLHARVARLKEADTVFHLDPLHAEGDVDLAFFYDPDGTMIELVEGDLQYHEVYDRSAVEADWALGRPARPRFDHIGETVESLTATQQFFAAFGFTRMAGIHQPNDPRGFEIDFLRSGDVSLEVFTFAADTSVRTPQTVTHGFAAVQLVGGLPQGAPRVGTVAGADAFVDPDGLVVQVTGEPRGGRR